MKYLLLPFIILISGMSGLRLHAQGENNIWCFGQKVGLNFNTTPPSFFQHQMMVHEGSATVCDAAGNLLFYSSGSNNWDRSHNLMPNGSGLLGNGPTVGGINIGSSMMGVAILKSPANPQQYYMITTNAGEENLYNAYYSVIDMSLNGGMGDVIPSQKNIILATNVHEGIRIQTTNTCGDYWIILRDRGNPQYLAFEVTPAGINTTPAISTGMPYTAARINFNKTGTLATAGTVDIQLLSFNKGTGIFTPLGMLHNDLYGGYATAFSPDDSKLYGGTFLLQYDLSLLPNITAVQNSRTLIDTSTTFKLFLRNGPDGRIYTLPLAPYLGCIQNPNALGTACQYNDQALNLPNYNGQSYSELGNVIVVHEPKDTTINPTKDTIVCQVPTTTLKAPTDATGYLWSTGSTGSQVAVNQDGVYWLYSRRQCDLYIDSFRVRFVRFTTDLGPDTVLCKGDSILLDATVPGAGYRWQDGSTGATFRAGQKGRYAVTVTLATCSRSDSMTLDITAPYLVIQEPDTTICEDAAITLHAKANPESTYSWNDGSTAPEKVVNKAGVYTVTAENVCGTFSDSVHIETMYCNCKAYAPNAFSPNGDGKNDRFVIELHCPGITAYRHYIYNRFGQRVFESQEQGRFWDGSFGGRPSDAGAYFYYIEYKNGNEKVIKKGDLVLVR